MMINVFCIIMLTIPYALGCLESQGNDRVIAAGAEQGNAPEGQSPRALFIAALEEAIASNDAGRVEKLCSEHDEIFTNIKRDADQTFKRFSSDMIDFVARCGNLLMLRGLIHRGIKVHDQHDTLHQMVRENNVEIVKELLGAGADSNFRIPPYQNQAIHEAFRPEIIRLLHAAGADINAQNVHGETALWFIMRRYMRPDSCSVGYAGMQELCRLGADVNLGGTQGLTPLHFATYDARANPHFVQLLLNHGAMPNACDMAGGAPFRRASSHGARSYPEAHRAVLRLLHAHEGDSDL